jgi:hypothetical protein
VGALLAVAFVLAPSADAYVYWANKGGTTIGRANQDSSGANQSFIGGVNGPCGVAVDAAYVYWASIGSGVIGRANLDGSAPSSSFIPNSSTFNSPCGVAANASHLYWTNFLGAGTTVRRANLDGTGAGAIVTSADNPCGVAMDAGHVYWANAGNGTIGRAGLDGSSPKQDLVSGGSFPCGVAVDGTYVYWANNGGTTIGRASLDGGGADQGFITGANAPCGIAVDGAYIYWANQGSGTIARASLTGGSVDESFITGATSPCGVAVDALGTSPGSGGPGTVGPGAVGPGAGSPALRLGMVTRNTRRGTALLTVAVTGPGRLVLTGHDVRRATKRTSHAGKVKLLVTPKGAATGKLNRTGKAKVKLKVTFTPTSAAAVTRSEWLRLIKRRR